MNYGFEFQCSIIEYEKKDDSFSPIERLSSGSVPIHAGLFHGHTRDVDAAREIAMAAAKNLITTASIEFASPGVCFPEAPASDELVTAAQIHELADSMESGKLKAKAYSLTKMGENQILQFIITTKDV